VTDAVRFEFAPVRPSAADFTVSADNDGDKSLDCPLCHGWIEIRYDEDNSLGALMTKAAEHLRVCPKNAVVEGSVVPARPQLEAP
jgi:hypothetical protein